jgi:hypothetical protein
VIKSFIFASKLHLTSPLLSLPSDFSVNIDIQITIVKSQHPKPSLPPLSPNQEVEAFYLPDSILPALLDSSVSGRPFD